MSYGDYCGHKSYKCVRIKCESILLCMWLTNIHICTKRNWNWAVRSCSNENRIEKSNVIKWNQIHHPNLIPNLVYCFQTDKSNIHITKICQDSKNQEEPKWTFEYFTFHLIKLNHSFACETYYRLNKSTRTQHAHSHSISTVDSSKWCSAFHFASLFYSYNTCFSAIYSVGFLSSRFTLFLISTCFLFLLLCITRSGLQQAIHPMRKIEFSGRTVFFFSNH